VACDACVSAIFFTVNNDVPLQADAEQGVHTGVHHGGGIVIKGGIDAMAGLVT
jgi:hypothetical protein